MTGKTLILGAKGRFGRHAAEAFWNAGWQVRLFDRASGNLMAAAQGMDVIVNGWNPAYPDWAEQLPRLSAQVIDAAIKLHLAVRVHRKRVSRVAMHVSGAASHLDRLFRQS